MGIPLKVMRVMPLIETQRNGELESLNQSSKACYLNIKYLEDMLNVIHQKIDYLDNDLHYTDIQIMDKQKTLIIAFFVFMKHNKRLICKC